MINNTIDIHGIETNNLKDISVSLNRRAINLIIGPSGSGKSSLAYDTIAQIGQHELRSMFDDAFIEPTYKVRSYSNMIVSVPIKQTNNNSNVRSTIGTYFHINQSIVLLFSALLNIESSVFVLNKEDNLCPQCHGLGFLSMLDVNRLIDYDVPLVRCPVKCWTRNRDFYIDIIRQYCDDYGIDYNKNFRMLTNEEKRLFLYGESQNKYSIRYKKTGSYSRRTTKFYGIMTNIPMMPKFIPGKIFFSEQECPLCNGEKYSVEHRNYKLEGLSIGELMQTPFNKINDWVESIQNTTKGTSLEFSIARIAGFTKKAVELNLGHLFFNRSIPSLSGGELQRLRLIQVFNTQLSDLLVVLDEPLAGLSGTERQGVYINIIKMAERHTMLIVDHHDAFFNDAANIIALGKGGGKNGGEIIDENSYISSLKLESSYTPLEVGSLAHVVLNNQVYGFLGADLQIALGRLNIITGASGVGKSTLLREYFPQYFEDYSYISQKVLWGNSHSSVATVLNVFNLIIECFASKYNKDKRFFSNLSGCDGACPVCSGSGYIFYGDDYQARARLECKECNGTGFNKNLKGYTFNGKTIFEIWAMTLNEALEFYCDTNKKIADILLDANEIMLGHLQIGQPTSTLSGGENIRIKLIKSLRDTSKVYGIDEPFRGLSNVEIFKLIQFINRFVAKNKTVIIADHEEESFRYFTKQIPLSNDNGILVGHL